MLKEMTDEELHTALDEASVRMTATYAACNGRPRWTIGFHGVPHERLVKMQEEWDEAHPGLYAVASDASDLASQLRDEADRRRACRIADARVFGVLSSAPRILALIRGGTKDTAATDAVTEWARTTSWCLLLLGGVGCGKSTAAAKYALDFARMNPKLRVPLWARAVEASRMSAFGDTAEDRFASWREAPLLVMDDLGTELMTATWQQALDDVLDWRYQHSLLTILPSNLTQDEFKKRYGERIADRIREDGTVRELSSRSMRRRP